MLEDLLLDAVERDHLVARAAEQLGERRGLARARVGARVGHAGPPALVGLRGSSRSAALAAGRAGAPSAGSSMP
jgi:hypothetical protein